MIGASPITTIRRGGHRFARPQIEFRAKIVRSPFGPTVLTQLTQTMLYVMNIVGESNLLAILLTAETILSKEKLFMPLISRFAWQTRALVALTCALVLVLSSTALAFASVTLVQLSSDPYTNTSSQHKTEVEPDNYSFGSTIVAVTQAGRFFSGGSSNIGWATSTNGGSTW